MPVELEVWSFEIRDDWVGEAMERALRNCEVMIVENNNKWKCE